MWRLVLVVALLSCGKSKEEQAREKLCRSDRDSAADYLGVAVESLDRVVDGPKPDEPMGPRTPDKDPDTDFVEQALHDWRELTRKTLVVEQNDADARAKLRGPAKQTLKHAIDELKQQDGDPVAAAKSAQAVYAQLDELTASKVKQDEALLKDVIALRDRIDGRPAAQIKNADTREQLVEVRKSVDLQARLLELARKPPDVYGVHKLALQQVITDCAH